MNGQEIKHYMGHEFWRINAGHVGAAIIFLAGMMIGFGKMSSKLDGITEWKSEAGRRIERMDAQGTYYGRASVELEKQIIQEHEARLLKTEDAIGRISVIGEKVDRLTEDIKELKPKPSK